MAVPYTTTNAGTNVRDALGKHLRIKHNNDWQYVEDVNIKDGGTWYEAKEVHIKSGGTWHLVHEGEHYLFKHDLNSNSTGNFDLALWISNFYGGNKIKGLLTITGNIQRQRVDLGNFSSDSRVYLRLEGGAKLIGAGGSGGFAGQGGTSNGGNGGRALYTRTKFILDNGGTISGGGGGGAGGANGTVVQQIQETNNCMKGNQCTNQYDVTQPQSGGGGGGGAGYPGGANGGNGAQNGQINGGGQGGAGGAGSAKSGGNGGGLGNDGANPQDNVGGTRGTKGIGVDGWGYRDQINAWGDGDGDVRGTLIN